MFEARNKMKKIIKALNTNKIEKTFRRKIKTSLKMISSFFNIK